MSGARTVVAVLGASNVALGLPDLVASVRGFARGPFDLLVAGGHGRSYGLDTRILARSLPPLRTSELFADLERLSPAAARTHLSITDVGNDVGYGVPAAEILAWVAGCLAQRPPNASTSLGLPPAATLGALSDRALERFRRLFFPSSRHIPLARLREQLEELDRGLRRMADDFDVVVEPDPEWYGWDPIHVRRSRRMIAWCRHLECAPSVARRRGRDALLRLARPSRWKLFGLELGRRQPVALESDSRLWLR